MVLLIHRREAKTISKITVSQSTQISLSIDTKILKDLDVLSKETDIARVKIINAVLDHYLYYDDLVIVYGHKEINVKEILKKE